MILFAAFDGKHLIRINNLIGNRFYSTVQKTCSVLDRWLTSWEAAAPPVNIVGSVSAPTALSWLRRRGPGLPNALLHKWFREEKLRLYDPCTSKVTKVKKSKQLTAGAILLAPRSLLTNSNSGHPSSAEAGVPASRPKPQLALTDRGDIQNGVKTLSDEEEEARMQFVRELRRRVLYHDSELIALDKPSGLAVQGGSGVPFSVDDLMQTAFNRLVKDSSQLRLVHRLDQNTSGVLCLAKSPDAAAWLSEAFRSASAAATGMGLDTELKSGNKGSAYGQGPALELRKTYWAVVVKQQPKRDGRLGLAGLEQLISDKGSIDLAVVPGNGRGLTRDGRVHLAALPAHTKYTLRRQSEELAWIELRPQTGRKHQLRIHCAQGLGAPILGDTKYGAVRQLPQRAILEDLKEAEGGWPQDGRPPMFLHCRSILLKRPGKEAIRIVAPPPSHWSALFRMQRWRDLEAAATRQQVAKRRQRSMKR